MSAEPMTPDEALRVLSEQPGAMVPGTERSRALEVVVTALDEARAELARRDTTITAVRKLAEEKNANTVNRRTQGGGLLPAIVMADDVLAALSAPVEAGATEPAPDALAAHASISLDRPDGPNGSVDATCKCGAWATVLNDAEARAWWDEHKAGAVAEAGAPAEPGYQRIADAIEAACDTAALALDARRDGIPVEDPYLRLARVLDKAGLIDWSAFAGAPAEPTSDTAECGECGHPRTDHPEDQACRAVLRPLWAPDDECWCGRYVAAGAADTAREDQP